MWHQAQPPPRTSTPIIPSANIPRPAVVPKAVASGVGVAAAGGRGPPRSASPFRNPNRPGACLPACLRTRTATLWGGCFFFFFPSLLSSPPSLRRAYASNGAETRTAGPSGNAARGVRAPASARLTCCLLRRPLPPERRTREREGARHEKGGKAAKAEAGRGRGGREGACKVGLAPPPSEADGVGKGGETPPPGEGGK